MAQFFEMPQATPTMETGTIASWEKQPGDALAPGDIVAVVETDKAAADVEIFDKTTLLKILVPEGDDVPAGFPIAIIGNEGEDTAELEARFASMEPVAAEAAPEPTPEPVPVPASEPEPATPVSAGFTAPTWEGRTLDSAIMELGTFSVEEPAVRASPVARRMAKERGISLQSVVGSGPHGRIVKADVEATGTGARRTLRRLPDEQVRNSKMRKVIASRLKESYLDAPAFFLTANLECDRLVDFRTQLKEAGTKVSYNDLVVKAMALALREVPECNAAWGEDAITRYGGVDIGVAVALPDGLITPVVRDADQKDLASMSAEIRDLAGRAKDRKLDAADYTGASFTISNLGMMDIEQFTAILNPPAAGILAVGSLQQEPVVIEGDLGIGWRMRVTMTCDHRVIDGALGARLLQAFRANIENPLRMLL